VQLSLTGGIASASAELSLIHFLAPAPRCEYATYALRFLPVDAKNKILNSSHLDVANRLSELTDSFPSYLD
jgi:hypothetical protein